MKRKLIFELDTDRGELIISDENREIWKEDNLGLIEIEGYEAAFRNGSARLFNRLKDIGNEYLFAKYGIKHFLGQEICGEICEEMVYVARATRPCDMLLLTTKTISDIKKGLLFRVQRNIHYSSTYLRSWQHPGPHSQSLVLFYPAHFRTTYVPIYRNP